METHLLAVSIGPVQDFIAQARRTRDLWSGSHLLSELSREVARVVQAAEGSQLIFPHPEQVAQEGSGVANKVLALVRGDPAALARKAREAARGLILREWESVCGKHRALVSPSLLPGGSHASAVNEQLDTFLEFYAAWAPCPPEDKAAYAEARREVEQRLGARKRLQDFRPWLHQRGGTPKSSLDGARESVLVPPGGRQGRLWGQFRIGHREELDALGLIKRTRTAPGQFVPVPTIGLEHWIQRANTDKHRPALERLRAICREYDEWLTPVQRKGSSWLRHFPYDGQLLLPERWEPHFRDCGLEGPQAKALAEKLSPPLKVLRSSPSEGGIGEPFPYVACLVADGDRMGKALDALAEHGLTAHQQISQALARFAQEAKEIVEQRHHGVLVYSGGDDVLAFLSLPRALECAQSLSQAFEGHVRPVLEQHGVEVRPTLSVGLGLGHVLESLGDLLHLGRDAEKTAKRKGRNRLALTLARHSGRELRWSAPWREDRSQDPLGLLESDLLLLNRGLPMKKVHELEALFQRLPDPRDVLKSEDSHWRTLLDQEARRVLARSELGSDRRLDLSPLRLGAQEEGEAGTEDYATCRARWQSWTQRVQVAELLRRAGWEGRKVEEGRP